MKKILLLIISIIFVSNLFGQFKVNAIGEARLWTNNMGPWDNTMITVVNSDYSKAYVVAKGCETCNHRFFVRGDGYIYSRGSYITSDSTLKEDIQQIPNALNKLVNLHGVTYYFTEDEDIIESHSDNHNVLKDSMNVVDAWKSKNLKSKKKEMGLIAQNVLEYVPEAVDTFENGILAVSYDALVGLLIEGMKEQQTQIETIQQIVYSQEQELIKLKSTVEGCCKNENQSKSKSSTIDETIFENAKLFENVPNPFSSNTKIKFDIPKNSTSAKLLIHNIQGVELKSFEIIQKGFGSITINGSEFKAGMYLYTLLIDNKIIDTKRMLLTKD